MYGGRRCSTLTQGDPKKHAYLDGLRVFELLLRYPLAEVLVVLAVGLLRGDAEFAGLSDLHALYAGLEPRDNLPRANSSLHGASLAGGVEHLPISQSPGVVEHNRAVFFNS